MAFRFDRFVKNCERFGEAVQRLDADGRRAARVTAQLTDRFSSTQFMRPVRLNRFADRYAVRRHGMMRTGFQLPP